MEEKYGHNLTVKAIRSSLDQSRLEHLQEGSAVPDLASVLIAAEGLLSSWLKPTLLRSLETILPKKEASQRPTKKTTKAPKIVGSVCRKKRDKTGLMISVQFKFMFS